MYKLFRKIPSGKTYADLVAEDPNVNFDYVIDEATSLADHDDVTTIENWDKYWSETIEEYGIARQAIHTLAHSIGWEELTHAEKMVAIKYRAYPNADSTAAIVVGYLMGLGYTQGQAAGLLIQNGAQDQVKLIQSCTFKGTHQNLYMILGMYLSISDQGALNGLVETLLTKYMGKGLRGTKDGQDGLEGLYDFIEGTEGTVYETVNISTQGYVMQNGDPDTNNLIADLMDWLKYQKTNF